MFKLFSFLLAITQVAIHTDAVADNMNAIEITGASSAKNYIPIKREGSEPSRLPPTPHIFCSSYYIQLHLLLSVTVKSDLPPITLQSKKVIEAAYRVPFDVTVSELAKLSALRYPCELCSLFVVLKGMKLVKKDDTTVDPVTINSKAAADCTASTGAPCYVKIVAGRFLFENVTNSNLRI